MTILNEILEHKRLEVERAQAVVSVAEMRARADEVSASPRGFREALLQSPAPAVIAEIKRRSPSKGLIRQEFDPLVLARSYSEGGAAALSVLTDRKFFGGDLAHLSSARGTVDLPLLRKDFLIDPYQVDEALVAGADAVLLIVAALDSVLLSDLYAHASKRGLDVLVEVHDEPELETALACGAQLLGINNRNLGTFEVDLEVTERLAASLPEDLDIVLVAESGIYDNGDIVRLQSAGAKAFLVGESLMRQPDVAHALRNLRRAQ